MTRRLEASIHSGSGTAVVAAAATAIVDADPSDATVAILADALAKGVDPDAVIDTVARGGFTDMPAFACVWFLGDAAFALLRGEAAVTIDGARTLDAANVRSWREADLDIGSAHVLELSLPSLGTDPTPTVVPIVTGVAPARRVAVNLLAATVTATSAPAAPAPPTTVPPTRSSGPAADPAAPSPAVSAPTPPAPTPPVPVPSAPPAPATRSAPSQTGASTGVDDVDMDLDHLLGHTVYKPTETAPAADAPPASATAPAPPASAIPRDASDLGIGTGEVAEPAPPAPLLTSPTIPGDVPLPNRTLTYVAEPTDDPAAPRVEDVPPATPGFISAVPGREPVAGPASAPPRGGGASDGASVSGPSDAPGPASPLAASTPTIDPQAVEGATVSVATLRAMAERAAASGPSGATVQAVHCPAGHANPTHADRCRRCDVAIVDRDVRTIERPTLGVLVFEDGTREPLDGPVIIGRNPPDGGTVEGTPARVVRRPDPANVLSRVHVEVRVSGWQVSVVDRDSVNYTFVEIPGRAPFQLRPGDPQPIPPGTVVRMGEDAAFTYFVPA